MGGFSFAMERVLLFLVVVLPSVFAEQLSAKECEGLGFTGLAYAPTATPSPKLIADCRKCCTEDSDDSMSKVVFSGAVLEVCMRKLPNYPELLTFIEEEKDQFPNVKVQYVYSSPRSSVDNWKREHIRQFLREKVKGSVGGQTDYSSSTLIVDRTHSIMALGAFDSASLEIHSYLCVSDIRLECV
ncbi:unnamed protein product [Spirodela intermedia]|uniref:Selenoprotein F n=1 Tax=Spirodela intermedia TaxID=51605 RepID=A0A7I8JC46_SPIIN|nr:unnamed protein product [Spirodela intermedia]CAA6667726.1 unnamed protein product [Spirodela intermedia]